uniref:Uncharacterized protein n=1 Tax=Panagrolaimus sp. ES5 TaxID=591445 RepID=A0AC34FX94_9BILA
MIIKYNAISHFLDMLSSDKEELQKEAILAFMGIMGHGPKYRDYCIKAGLVDPLIDLVEDSETSIDVLYDIAVMMYYISQEGKPIVPYETVVKILPAIKTLIELKSDNEKMDGILISAIGSLAFIEKSGFERVRLIVNKNFVEKIVPFLHHPHSDVQKMTIFALNKIMDGNSTYHQHVLDHGILKNLHILLNHPTDSDIIGEALEFLIHVIAPNNTHISDVFAEPNLMPLVIKAFDIPKIQIQITATEVILVTAVQGTVEQIEYIIENGVAAAICKHMKVLNFETYDGSDENVLDTLLRLVKKGKKKLGIMFDELDKCGGMD